MRKRTPLGPYCRPMPRVVGESYGDGRCFMDEESLYMITRLAKITCCRHQEMWGLQGYLAHKETHPPRTLP